MRQTTALAAMLLCGCGNVLQGSLTVEGQAQDRPWSMTPDECESGERSGFFGVDMWTQGTEGAHIRAILDARDGPTVKLDIPGVAEALTLTPGPACKQLELQVERQNSRTNDIVHVRGHLRLECVDSGLALRADISFEDCH